MQKNTKEKDRQTFWKEMEEERQYRRAKRHCMVLGIAVIALGGILAGRSLQKEQQTVLETGWYSHGDTNQVHVSERYKILEKKDSDQEKNTAMDLLLLVNKEHELPEDYEVKLHWLNNGSCAVAEVMYEALKEMLTEGSADGREFAVASGYRSRERQRELLDEDILAAINGQGLSWQEAYEQETRETMPPGYSEHETGLAVDIVALNYQLLDEGQERTPENQWLQDNCWKYGFILRYPREKEEITGVSYEAWHFRYVGKEAAKEIMEQGITLEEYVGERQK